MFNNKSKIDPTTVETTIGETTIIEGTIKTEASLMISGQVFGAVESNGNVTIDTKGIVNASINAKQLEISGIVRGNVMTEKLIIRNTGKLYGDTNAKALIIDEGGKLLGKSNMEMELMSEGKQRKVQESSSNDTTNTLESSNVKTDNENNEYQITGSNNSPL